MRYKVRKYTYESFIRVLPNKKTDKFNTNRIFFNTMINGCLKNKAAILYKKNYRKAVAKKSNLIWTVDYKLGLFSISFTGILNK
ncbi:TPR-domain containing protein [Chryseobacterium sp. StRB126]|nr:TPR-domain containing protein [Chryseobacterium sp. StRB126]